MLLNSDYECRYSVPYYAHVVLCTFCTMHIMQTGCSIDLLSMYYAAVETGMPSGGLHGEQRSLDTISESASLDTPVARAPPPPTGAVGGSAEGPASHEESPHGQSSQCSCLLLFYAVVLCFVCLCMHTCCQT